MFCSEGMQEAVEPATGRHRLTRLVKPSHSLPHRNHPLPIQPYKGRPSACLKPTLYLLLRLQGKGYGVTGPASGRVSRSSLLRLRTNGHFTDVTLDIFGKRVAAHKADQAHWHCKAMRFFL